MQNKFSTYQPLVIQWAEERNILAEVTPKKQLLKTYEEIGELLEAIEDNNLPEIQDAIGDVIISLIIYSEMKKINIPKYSNRISEILPYPIKDSIYALMSSFNKLYHESGFKQYCFSEIFEELNYLCRFYKLNIEDCLESAYHTIKDRKGTISNGQFVKDKQ